jgi:hypothetical protein
MHAASRTVTIVGGYAGIQKSGTGGGCADDAERRRRHKANVRQQKSEDRDATPDLLLKHTDATLATYYLCP